MLCEVSQLCGLGAASCTTPQRCRTTGCQAPKCHLLSQNPLHELPPCPNQPQGRGRSLSSAFRNLAAPHPLLPYLPLLRAGPCAGTELLKAAPRAWRCSDSPAARDWGLQTFKRSRGLRRFPFPLSQAVVSPRLPLILQRFQVTQWAVLTAAWLQPRWQILPSISGGWKRAP